jgi:DNA-binding CsgD family transcriptional regulator
VILYGTGARATPPEAVAHMRSTVVCWGSGATLDLFARSQASDPVARSARGRLERASASPALALATFEALGQADAQEFLDQIHVPALVVHRLEDIVPIDEGRFLAERIRGAEIVEIDGGDHLPWVGETGLLHDAVARFLSQLEPSESSRHRPAAQRRRTRGLTGVTSLTGRELEVAELVARGMTNPEISRKLYLSRHTVESHLKSISTKLGVQGRTKIREVIRRTEDP